MWNMYHEELNYILQQEMSKNSLVSLVFLMALKKIGLIKGKCKTIINKRILKTPQKWKSDMLNDMRAWRPSMGKNCELDSLGNESPCGI